MKRHISHQILEKEGKPLFVVVPYEEYVDLIKGHDNEITIPHEVIRKNVVDGKSLVRAWREFKNLSQKEIARKMEISQSAYAQMERSDANLRRSTMEKIAQALGVEIGQLQP